MKTMKKLSGILISLFLMVGLACSFVSCSNDDDGSDTTPEVVNYSISFEEDTSALSVNVDESITLTVKEKTGTWKISTDETSGSLKVEETATGYKITGVSEDANAKLKLYPVEAGNETKYDVELTINVVQPYYTLNLTLADDVAAKAATITVYAEGKENNVACPEEKKQTVAATYTAGEKTATAKLEKAKANNYNYFNNIVVTIKDSSDNAVAIALSTNYFCWSATSGDGYITGITISAAVTSKTFTINFENFTIPGGSVTGIEWASDWKETWADRTTYTVSPVVAADGASATFEIEAEKLTDKKEFYINFGSGTIKALKSDGTEQEISTKSVTEDKWYSYDAADTDWNVTFSYVALTDADYTETLATNVKLPENTPSSATVVLLSDSITMPSSAKAFKLVYTVGENDKISASTTWITFFANDNWEGKIEEFVNAWKTPNFSESATSFTYYITDKDVVAKYLAGNFYVEADTPDYTGTFTITYAK